ncbi:MAG TPA: hypothetical protein VNJ02_17790 [Vicinamibacterales bacterium]|nr:hypothetical protein [Vicinamibacterales bacterium]
MPVSRGVRANSASPHLTYVLAMNGWPPARLPGWVNTCITGGSDNLPRAELLERYGPGIEAECQRAGFCAAALLKPGEQWSAAESAAAERWSVELIQEHRY